MTFSIRAAEPRDLPVIAEFTANTFDWGDYISDFLPRWIQEDQVRVLVATDDAGVAIAVGTGHMVSPTEGWLQGTRVSETWRRQGVASAIGEELIDWTLGQGAQIVRLITEGWNTAAQRQVGSAGFIQRGTWVIGRLAIKDSEPTVATNGGKRAKAHRKLELAHSSEAIPAWSSWRSGPLVAPARGLYFRYWKWQRLTADHLETSARESSLWSSQTGWATTYRDEGTLYVSWLDCGPDDALDMVKSLVDLALESRSDSLRIAVPPVDWLVDALDRIGCEPHQMVVYERPL